MKALLDRSSMPTFKLSCIFPRYKEGLSFQASTTKIMEALKTTTERIGRFIPPGATINTFTSKREHISKTCNITTKNLIRKFLVILWTKPE